MRVLIGMALRYLARRVYAKKRAQLKYRRSLILASNLVNTCVRLEFCTPKEALKIKRELDWKHEMSRFL